MPDGGRRGNERLRRPPAGQKQGLSGALLEYGSPNEVPLHSGTLMHMRRVTPSACITPSLVLRLYRLQGCVFCLRRLGTRLVY
eukprot:4291016-Prymnesium_polylepis.1